MAETLKLCVSCKACRRECPTGVDMARMKIEVQAARAREARPVAARPAGRLSAALRALCARRCRGWSICATRCRRLRRVVRDARRLFRAGAACRNGARTFTATARTGPTRASRRAATSARGRAVRRHLQPLFRARKSRRRARACCVAGGYRVHAAQPADGDERPLCCGRTFLSVGAVDEARARDASARSPRSRRMSTRGVPVIGLEPSCLLTLPRRDAGADARTRRPRRLPGSALLFEEFLAREHDDGAARSAAQAARRTKALLHGHCHQKAFDAMGAVETRAQARARA